MQSWPSSTLLLAQGTAHRWGSPPTPAAPASRRQKARSGEQTLLCRPSLACHVSQKCSLHLPFPHATHSWGSPTICLPPPLLSGNRVPRVCLRSYRRLLLLGYSGIPRGRHARTSLPERETEAQRRSSWARVPPRQHVTYSALQPKPFESRVSPGCLWYSKSNVDQWHGQHAGAG